jgi:acyl-CoA synthetase (AMP-forming)/AMP-acid ligase II/pimeloyl-ACP methyl ester carboxylesterase
MNTSSQTNEKTLIVAVGGLPLVRKVWEPLKFETADLYDWKIYEDSSQDFSSWFSAVADNKNVYLLAHSMGAVEALSMVEHPSVKKVFLITPSFPLASGTKSSQNEDKQVSSGKAWIVKQLFTKKFLKNYFHPFEHSKGEVENALGSILSQTESWQRLLKRRSLLQQKFLQTPLHSLHAAALKKCRILWGEEDRAVQRHKILKTFSSLAQVNQWVIPEVGHQLLWKEAKRLSQFLHDERIFSIGYYPGKSVKNNVLTYMDSHLEKHPKKVALKWVDLGTQKKWHENRDTELLHKSCDYEELAKRINAFAKGLIKIGIHAGDRVILFLPMGVDMYTCMFAIQKIGAIAVFLDSWARSNHLGATAETVAPKLMISFEQAFELVKDIPAFQELPLRILYAFEMPETYKDGLTKTYLYKQVFSLGSVETEAVESETTALITFTTGSTGTPKGANRTHRFLSAQHRALEEVIAYPADAVDMPLFPIFSLNNLAAGVTTVLPAINLADPKPTDGELIVKQLLQENVTHLTLSPSHLQGVIRYCQEQQMTLKRLVRVVTGGAPISLDQVKAFYECAPQSELWILYGSTEAEPMAHIEGREMIKSCTLTDPECVELGVNVGEIAESLQTKFIRLYDGPIQLGPEGWSEWEVKPGEIGEFICAGDHVCQSYFNNEQAFASTKILSPEGQVFHRTGDLAYRDAQGHLWIVGRVNNAIERLGKYYFPVPAEILLKRFPFVERAAFLGLGPRGQQETAAVLQLRTDHQLIIEDENLKQEVLVSVQRIFAKNKIPLDRLYFVANIPMDPRHHSKVEYSILRSQLEGQSFMLKKNVENSEQPYA